jgi:hypothetical protein
LHSAVRVGRFEWIVNGDCGFSIVESVVASTIMIVGIASVAQLFYITARANVAAKSTTMTTLLAREKIEQLRSLEWGFDALGLPVSDTTTNTSTIPELPTGGTGLSPSPAGTLSRSTIGYVDYIDGAGKSLGGSSATAPPGTVYVRRWSVEPLPTNPTNTLVLQVAVTPYTNGTKTVTPTSATRQSNEVRMVSVKTRKAM